MSEIGVANLVEEYGVQAAIGVFTLMGATPGGMQSFYLAIQRGMVSPFFCTVRSAQKNIWYEGLASLSGSLLTFSQVNTNSAGGNIALDMTGATVILYNQVPAESLVFSNGGVIPIPPSYQKLSVNFTVSIADALSRKLYDVDASAGQIIVTYPPNLTAGCPVTISKVDTSANFILITTDGSTLVDAITIPANASGQVGGWRIVYSDGSVIHSLGVG